MTGERRRPRIGLTLSMDEKLRSYTLPRSYVDSLQREGADVLVLPWQEPSRAQAVLAACDGLLLSGGQDVNGKLWGANPEELAQCQPPHDERDAWESALLAEALARDIPVLAVCRGFQLLNVHCGGTLHAELKRVLGDDHLHEGEDYGKEGCEKSLMHDVQVTLDPALRELWFACSDSRSAEFRVNSYHHQALNRLAEGMEVLCTSPDGLIEAGCYAPARWVYGVQWHPEIRTAEEARSRALFRSFVRACRS